MIEINLLKRFQIEPDRSFRNFTTWIFGFWVILTLILIFPAYSYMKLKYLEIRIQSASEKLAAHTETFQQLSRLNQLLDANRVKEASIQKIKNEGTDWKTLLDILRAATPKEVVWNSVSGEGETIKITGSAAQGSMVVHFMYNLRGLPQVNDLTLDSVSGVNGGTDFSLSVAIKKGWKP